MVVRLSADLSGTKTFSTSKSCCPVEFWWSVLNVEFHLFFCDFVDETTEWTLCVRWRSDLMCTGGSSDDAQTGSILLVDARATIAELVSRSYSSQMTMWPDIVRDSQRGYERKTSSALVARASRSRMLPIWTSSENLPVHTRPLRHRCMAVE